MPPAIEIIVLIGLPFSGKSTIARKLANENVELISRDEILEAFADNADLQKKFHEHAATIKQPTSNAFPTREKNAYNDVVTAAYVARVVEIIQNSSARKIIVDGTHLQKLSRSFISAFPDAITKAIVCETPTEVCVERMQSTERTGLRQHLSAKDIFMLSRAFEMPTREEGFDEIMSATELI